MQSQSQVCPSSPLASLPLWSAAELAGLKTEQVRRLAPFFRGLIRRLAKKCRAGARSLARPGEPESFPLLAEAVVGSSRSMIFGVFGPPRAAVTLMEFESDAEAAIWEAPTWYYALPNNGPLAMAIRFDEDFAAEVEYVGIGQMGE